MPDTTPVYLNHILAELPAKELAVLSRSLEKVEIKRFEYLVRRNVDTDYIYFVETGVVSITLNKASSPPVEIGLIGREGIVGFNVLSGGRKSYFDGICRIDGTAWRLPAETLSDDGLVTKNFAPVLMRYAREIMLQSARTIAAIGQGNIEQRLARLLLMVQDRIGGSEIKLTHDSLAQMIGVRRPGVTIALATLSEQGYLSSSRGSLIVLDRAGLVSAASNLYGPMDSKFLHPDSPGT